MDDEEGVRKVLGQTLEGMGHAVELAEDGQSGHRGLSKSEEPWPSLSMWCFWI